MSASASLIDYPASYHYSGTNLGFADGSVLYHQWYSVSAVIGPFVPRISGLDVAWLQNRTTYAK
jgi:prepilin-type processing-associated H-X9-DG protein